MRGQMGPHVNNCRVEVKGVWVFIRLFFQLDKTKIGCGVGPGFPKNRPLAWGGPLLTLQAVF